MPPSGKDIVKALVKAGFIVNRVKGSNHMLSHFDGRRTTVPTPDIETYLNSGLLIAGRRGPCQGGRSAQTSSWVNGTTRENGSFSTRIS
jgi:predicted RNA binding protein YcfA (HicA-like mRNA interferase family)